MSKIYSDAFIEQALIKVYSRGKRSVQSVADDINVKVWTVKNWIRRKSMETLSKSTDLEKRPQDWQRHDQLLALQETHGMEREALQAWCREHGLFAHHLEEWRKAFCVPDKATASDPRTLHSLQNENDKLKRELDRKDKALAEAAALLLLQKKFNALWEDEVK